MSDGESRAVARTDPRDMTPEQLDDLLHSQTRVPTTPAEEADLLARSNLVSLDDVYRALGSLPRAAA